ncbi:histidine phosphatase family protein [Gottfriedia luciferensis]|uniref:histidine phosphatase family protein n=1 Tax=Gottfriedia luciferensis TaxID=178774 RepID=UPI001302E25E|nr:histidine phosphatase family protein [Gottfriedia luciferensis]
MLTLYLTRHGETQWNIENRLQGSKDSELTSKGIEDAKRLSNMLSEVSFNKIYTSSSKRAVTTANLLRNNLITPIIEVDGLKEINFGDWEGKTKFEINERSKKEFSSLWDSPHLYDHSPHSGESLIALRYRIANVIQNILNSNEEGNLLIVTHAVVLATIVAYFKQSPLENLWDLPFVHGTSLTIINVDQEKRLIDFSLLCDISHLDIT